MAWLLPEILKLSEQLNQVVGGKTIQFAQLGAGCATLRSVGMVNLDPPDFSRALEEQTVGKVTGRGRWLFLEVEPDSYLLLGEGSGSLRYYGSSDSPPSEVLARRRNYMLLDFTDESTLVYRIPGNGFIKVIRRGQVATSRYPGELGISPADEDEFKSKVFRKILDRHPEEGLRPVLANQQELAGLDSPYIDDILFRAKLHPGRKAGSLDKSQRKTLFVAVQEVLGEAIGLGGSADETDLFGKSGGYKERIGPRSAGQPCPSCRALIVGAKVRGEAAYFCHQCQH